MSNWSALVDSPLRHEALATARRIGATLADDARLAEIVSQAVGRSPVAEFRTWREADVAHGGLGVAYALGCLDDVFPDEGWDHHAHRRLERAAREVEDQPLSAISVFGGGVGLACAAARVGQKRGRYRKLLRTLDARLAPVILRRAEALEGAYDGVAQNEFDAVAGLSGALAYLLCRLDSEELADLRKRVLSALVSLCGIHDGWPRWRTPLAKISSFVTKRAEWYPHGSLNCGLAHGLPGILAALSLAHLSGCRVAGMEDAIARSASWLLANRRDDEWGMNWGQSLALGESAVSPPTPVGETARAAWCYGGPGVARSLWLAGRALDERTYREGALEAMSATLRRPSEERRLDSAMFCHGVAGYLHTLARFAHDTQLPSFREGAANLTAELLSLREADAPLEFRSLELDGMRNDNPGMLDGSAGVAAVLLAVASDVEPAWDRLFLLS